jgi:Fe-S oxidoreductase
MDDSLLSERPSHNRVAEALRLDVAHFVVACPKDMTMFSDAVKTAGVEDRLTVRDITLLVQEAMLP